MLQKESSRIAKRERAVVKCHCCQEIKNGVGYVKIQPTTRDTPAYVCLDCLELLDKKKFNNKGTIRYTDYNKGEVKPLLYQFELNRNKLSDSKHGLLISREYKFTAYKKDNDVLYDSIYYPSLHGIKRDLEAVESNSSNTNKIDTISITNNYYSSKCYNNVMLDNMQVFNKFIDTLANYDQQKVANLFGLSYQEMVKSGMILFDFKLASYSKFNLASMQDSSNYFYVVNMCKDIILTINKWVYDRIKEGIDPNFKVLENKLDNILVKYLENKANCMRVERNKKRV